MSEMLIPDALDDIPDDMPPEHLPHYGAQVAIQSVVCLLRTRGVELGDTAISIDDLSASLGMALAMLITANPDTSTMGDLLQSGAHWGRVVAGYVRILQENGDDTGAKIVRMLGLAAQDCPRA